MNKYHARKTEVDGIVFDSKREADRYCELRLLERAGVIKDLRRQVRFELVPGYVLNGKTIRPVSYVADFVYVDKMSGEEIVEDAKGFRTDVFKLKKKIFGYRYKKEIEEV